MRHIAAATTLLLARAQISENLDPMVTPAGQAYLVHATFRYSKLEWHNKQRNLTRTHKNGLTSEDCKNIR